MQERWSRCCGSRNSSPDVTGCEDPDVCPSPGLRASAVSPAGPASPSTPVDSPRPPGSSPLEPPHGSTDGSEVEPETRKLLA